MRERGRGRGRKLEGWKVDKGRQSQKVIEKNTGLLLFPFLYKKIYRTSVSMCRCQESDDEAIYPCLCIFRDNLSRERNLKFFLGLRFEI
jgi:hypothetical protein